MTDSTVETVMRPKRTHKPTAKVQAAISPEGSSASIPVSKKKAGKEDPFDEPPPGCDAKFYRDFKPRLEWIYKTYKQRLWWPSIHKVWFLPSPPQE